MGRVASGPKTRLVGFRGTSRPCTIASGMLGGPFNEEFLYLTTVGRKTGRVHEIEIWFVERDGRLYVLAEHGYKAN